MVDLVTLQLWLAESEAAMQRLATGTAVVSVTNGNRRVDYNEGDMDKLAAWIAWLRSAIADASGDAPTRRRPIYLGF